MASINDSWFEWKGHSSLEFGIVVLNLPPFQTPKERYDQIKIPGRPGSFTYLEGEDIYENRMLTITCIIDDPNPYNRILQISKWLRGASVLRLSTNPDQVYEARIINQISFDKVVRGNPHRSFQITFDASPFAYLADTAADTKFVENDSATIDLDEMYTIIDDDTNNGSVASHPIITVSFYDVNQIDYGSQSPTVLHDMVSSITIANAYEDYTIMIDKVYSESNNPSLLYPYIVIDTDNKYAYYGSTSCTSCLTGEWPRIPVGQYDISFNGLIKSVSINKKTRYLV